MPKFSDHISKPGRHNTDVGNLAIRSTVSCCNVDDEDRDSNPLAILSYTVCGLMIFPFCAIHVRPRILFKFVLKIGWSIVVENASVIPKTGVPW